MKTIIFCLLILQVIGCAKDSNGGSTRTNAITDKSSWVYQDAANDCRQWFYLGPLNDVDGYSVAVQYPDNTVYAKEILAVDGNGSVYGQYTVGVEVCAPASGQYIIGVIDPNNNATVLFTVTY
jgi:hypothetical protein